MADMINLTIDGIPVAVPKGTVIVDAAKKIDNDIPVFCYHPKLKPVGMCRMCLVEVGTPKMDPATKQVVKTEDGKAVIAWMPKLATACTTPVSEGMAVRTNTKQVLDARNNVLEFLLTSHPLDCPICDKGGECPLQNLTLAHGPGVSRFEYEAKNHNAKHVPLGDLIFLDRERCIQCSRCIRFQDDVADDHVLQFHDRGRHMEIVTFSDPPFDSYFGGNTTDICPVGALTTADFRFKARPWELDSTPSVCTHCAVGCNITLNTRLETRTGGHEIKRVMPRQNEHVNEIWTCDKGRFVHHFTRSTDRLTQPLVRDASGKLAESTWEAALQLVADKVRGKHVAGVIGDRLPNEDAFLFGQLLTDVIKTGSVTMSPAIPAAYADIVRGFGVGKDTEFKQIGKGDTILVVNGDLEESAPVWFLLLRQAVVDRGAKLVMAHDHITKMHRYATKTVNYELGTAANWAATETMALGAELKAARNVLIVFGDEKLSADGARALARALANIMIESGHAGKANSGLLPLYPHANTQGVFDALPEQLASTVAVQHGKRQADVAWLIGVGDPADVPQAAFTVVQELFLTDVAKSANVVLPALSFAERDGSFTSGDRRVQRFYRALPGMGQAKPDWWIIQEVAKRLGKSWGFHGTTEIFAALADSRPDYAGLTYELLGVTESQWPPVGRADLYYGGTAYDNTGGVGARYAARAEQSGFTAVSEAVAPPSADMESLQHLPRTLYQAGELISRSKVLAGHVEYRNSEMTRTAK